MFREREANIEHNTKIANSGIRL